MERFKKMPSQQRPDVIHQVPVTFKLLEGSKVRQISPVG